VGIDGKAQSGSEADTAMIESETTLRRLRRGTREWLALAARRNVVRRAAKTDVLVGTILIAINHGDAILSGSVDAGRLMRMALTFLVPYCVSTFSSVAAMRERTA